MTYVDVIVPLPLAGVFTYLLPQEFDANTQVGCRVIVQFGKKKYYTAIIQRIYQDVVAKEGVKEIVSLLDDSPIVLPQQLQFWEWIASYYICTLGDVYKAALPSALKLESESYVLLNEAFESQEKFTPNELKIFDTLSADKSLKIAEIQKLCNIANVIPYIKSLVDKGAAFLTENIKDTYSAKTETIIQLNKDISEENLLNLLNALSTRAKKQHHLLSFFLFLQADSELDRDTFAISKKQFLEKANVSTAVLDGLIEKEILVSSQQQISRFDYGRDESVVAKQLNTHQQRAYTEIQKTFESKAVTLLHGVTSSGKTEIYIQLIKDVIARGEQVLYLVPEIALTTQITERLRVVFGDKLAVYHSRFNDNERAETWNNCLNKEQCQVILGARSSIFLPFKRLGLVIVDEEHESSYKQQDPAPRYNARNAVLFLANMYGAKTLLGTATPAVETYYNALSGRYGLVELVQRHEGIEMPEIISVNIKELRRTKQMKSFLSPPLIERMRTSLSKDKQVILFQNRRGFSPLLECKTCSWTPKCEHCDVSLTYHKRPQLMVCHYCGASYSIPKDCPDCETPTLDTLGHGTERVEEEVVELFPDASTVRMDMDTTRSKRAYERIISDFEDNKNDILIGTQMVSKGLDFDNVNLVGILNADSLLNYPDFRAHERAYQMMTQVSGRAGRKNKQGLVVLQTSQPNHPIIAFVRDNDYQSFYKMQLEERRLFRYPPFYRLISITLRSKDESLLDTVASQFTSLLKQSFDERVLGPTKPPVARVQSLYIRKILLKIENSASPSQVREAIDYYKTVLLQEPKYRSILFSFDADPM